MIRIIPLDGNPIEHFEDYNELFECITSTETMKAAKRLKPVHIDWNFTIHHPKRASALYIQSKNPSEAIKEAFEENLALIEICTGDYKKPLYIPLTPNVDMDYLKRKWCIDSCTFHHILVKEA